MQRYAIAIHGGAGTVSRSMMSDADEAAYKAALVVALKAGRQVLEGKGSALDSVEAAVISLENTPLFNAGRGSAFSNDGRNEMDAAVMVGESLSAGAVAGVSNIKNPISLARAVMEKTEHVLLAGDGAARFARSIQAEFAPDEYFFDQKRFDQLQKAKKADGVFLDHVSDDEIKKSVDKSGTVGAVALDLHGNLAAATSTGGMTNKKFGRIGDSPLIGSGTYANNKTCAVSCTGHGEYFIRGVVAYDLSCLIEYRGMTLKDACHQVVSNKLTQLGGRGGLIAVDREGNIELPFNSEGMYRASMRMGEEMFVGVF